MKEDQVSANGLLPNQWEPDGVAKKRPDEGEVAIAAAWIQQFCSPTKSIRTRESSYGLKHRAERWAYTQELGDYVSNGAFIVAALRLGYRVKAERINAFFNMAISKEAAKYDRIIWP